MAVTFLLPSLLICIAGMSNGSYPALLKKLPDWTDETQWLFFSFLAFFIIPLVSISIVCPHWLTLFGRVATPDLAILAIGGVLFGIGMVLFTWALRLIGIGVSFVLNISLGTVFGSLVPMLVGHPLAIETKLGLIDVAALLLFVCSVVLISVATSIRDKNDQQNSQNNGRPSWYKAVLGIICGCLSGLFCAAQGASYGLVSSHFATLGVQLGIAKFSSLTTPWLVIFFAAFVIYAAYHYLLIRKKGLYVSTILTNTPVRYYGYLIVMGLLYFLPLIIYSKSVSLLGNQGPVIGWPLFMCFIILSANTWGCIRGEWSQAKRREIGIFILSLVFLIAAVIVLSWGTEVSIETNMITSQVHTHS
jgi:L-rhamnose-H+ transport protein